MIDWLAVWGVAQVGGAIAGPILGELAKGALEDYVKGFFGDCLGDLAEGFKPDDLKRAYGLALKEFLKLVEEELEFNQFQPAQIKEFKKPLKVFVQDERVAATLGLAFQEECRSIPARDLIKVWQELDSPYLPDEFDWVQISKGYIRAVKTLLKNSSELREIFSAQNLEQIAANTANFAGIQPDFNLAKYAETIQEQYGNLKLDSKELLTEIIIDLLQNRRDLMYEIILEALEEVGLANAITEGRQDDFVAEEEIFALLDAE